MNKWKFTNGAELNFIDDGKRNEPLRGIDFNFFLDNGECLATLYGDEMTTIYDIDELQRENEKLKDLLMRIAELYLEEEASGDEPLLKFMKEKKILKQLPSTYYGIYIVNMEFFND